MSTRTNAVEKIQTPVVTVILPVHNGESLLQRAIDSVLVQTEQQFELIVIDDGSTDNTWDVIAAAMNSDSRVSGLRNPVSLRAPAASNRGIDAARGRWIAILDHDDWYHPERLRTMLHAGEAANVDLVADNQYFFDAQASVVFRTAFRTAEGRSALTLTTLLKNAQTGVPKFDYGMLKPLIRTRFLRDSGVRYLPSCHEGYDFHLLLDAFAAGCTTLLLHRPYYFYTVPFGPLSRKASYATKKTYDYPRMRSFTERALAQYRDRLTGPELRLLAARGRSIAAYSKYLQTKDALRVRSCRQVLTGLCDPKLWPFIGRAAVRHLQNRLPKSPAQHLDAFGSVEDGVIAANGSARCAGKQENTTSGRPTALAIHE
jgi:succinoglycan biosynthesis protein ExoO